jgi:hypothetical protein
VSQLLNGYVGPMGIFDRKPKAPLKSTAEIEFEVASKKSNEARNFYDRIERVDMQTPRVVDIDIAPQYRDIPPGYFNLTVMYPWLAMIYDYFQSSGDKSKATWLMLEGPLGKMMSTGSGITTPRDMLRGKALAQAMANRFVIELGASATLHSPIQPSEFVDQLEKSVDYFQHVGAIDESFANILLTDTALNLLGLIEKEVRRL